jgi:hypothetical protein
MTRIPGQSFLAKRRETRRARKRNDEDDLQTEDGLFSEDDPLFH